MNRFQRRALRSFRTLPLAVSNATFTSWWVLSCRRKVHHAV
jgi:hypothetical protein